MIVEEKKGKTEGVESKNLLWARMLERDSIRTFCAGYPLKTRNQLSLIYPMASLFYIYVVYTYFQGHGGQW